MDRKKIRITEKQGTLINVKEKVNIEDKKVSFSFADFKTNSIKIDGFNNYYFNVESSKNAVADFFYIIREISNLQIKDLFSHNNKKEYHLNKLDSNEVILRIEKILKSGYGFSEGKIEEFEKEYFEFQISDGKRVICYKVDNVIFPLFIDCNHMVCYESSRNLKAKNKYQVKSSFCKQIDEDLLFEDKSIKEYLRIIVEEYSNLKDIQLEDIIDILKDIIS